MLKFLSRVLLALSNIISLSSICMTFLGSSSNILVLWSWTLTRSLVWLLSYSSFATVDFILSLFSFTNDIVVKRGVIRLSMIALILYSNLNQSNSRGAVRLLGLSALTSLAILWIKASLSLFFGFAYSFCLSMRSSLAFLSSGSGGFAYSCYYWVSCSFCPTSGELSKISSLLS